MGVTRGFLPLVKNMGDTDENIERRFQEESYIKPRRFVCLFVFKRKKTNKQTPVSHHPYNIFPNQQQLFGLTPIIKTVSLEKGLNLLSSFSQPPLTTSASWPSVAVTV